MKSDVQESDKKTTSEYFDFDRLILTLGYGFGHAFLGMLAGGFLILGVGTGIEAVNVMPPNIDPESWIIGGGIAGAVVGFIVGLNDMWNRAMT